MAVKNHCFEKRCIYCNKKSNRYMLIDGRPVCSDECAAKLIELREKAPYAGMHLATARGAYVHHGIGDLEGNIIHYSGVRKNRETGVICKTSLRQFCAKQGFKVIKHPKRKFSILSAVSRAESRIDEKVYDLPANNCEHFVFWSIEGKHMSTQVEYVVKVIAALCFIIVLAASLEFFALSGTRGLASSSWLGKVTHGSGLISLLFLMGVCGAMIIAIGLHISVFRVSPGMPSKDAKYKRIGKYSAYFSAVVYAGIGMLLLELRAQQTYNFGSELMDYQYLVRYVVLTLFYGTALPAVMTAITGYGIYKLCWYYNRYKELKVFDSEDNVSGREE